MVQSTLDAIFHIHLAYHLCESRLQAVGPYVKMYQWCVVCETTTRCNEVTACTLLLSVACLCLSTVIRIETYTGVYKHYGLLHERSYFAHCIHCSGGERALLLENGVRKNSHLNFIQ